MQTRRDFNRLLASLGLVPAVNAIPARAQTTNLVISWYPGLLGNNFRRGFYDTYDRRDSAKIIESFDNARFTQMQANRNAPTIDVGAFTDVMVPILGKSGLVTPLTSASVPNIDRVPRELRFAKDVAVPVTYGSWGIAYNAAKLKKPIQSWADLVGDELKGHVSAPNITYNSSIYTLDALSALKGGSIRQPDHGMAQMRTIRQNGPGLWDQESIAVGWLKTGEIWATPYFSGNVLALMRDPDLKDLRFAIPAEGAYYLGLNAAKIANSPNPAEADRFINHMLSMEAQEAWAQNGRARPVIADARMPEDVAATVPVFSKLKFVDWAYFGDNRDAIVAQWNQTVNR